MRKWKLAAILLAVAIMLAACSSNEEANQANSAGEQAANGEQNANNGADAANNETEANGNEGSEEPANAYPMTVKSTIGSTESEGTTHTFEDVTFEEMPERLVVYDYGFLDTLDALGVEGIVGIAQGSTLPSHLQHFNGDEYSNIGTLKGPLLEDIAELSPDVIFISGRQSAFYEELNEIAPVVFVGTQQNDYWNTFLASVDIATQMFGKEAEAEEYLSKFDSALEEINALAESYESTLVTMYNEGSLSGFASNSRFGYIYEIYGFTPVTEDIEASSHGSNFGFEALLEFDPEVLLVIDRTGAVNGGESNIAADVENDIVKRTQAFQNNRIVYLDGALWYLSGGGLQSELAKIDELLAELK